MSTQRFWHKFWDKFHLPIMILAGGVFMLLILWHMEYMRQHPPKIEPFVVEHPFIVKALFAALFGSAAYFARRFPLIAFMPAAFAAAMLLNLALAAIPNIPSTLF